MEAKNRAVGSGIAALLALYLIYGFAQAFNEYRVLFLQGQGLSAAQCGRVLAAASLLTAVARPLSGALADRLRARRPVLVGALLLWGAILTALLLTGNVHIAGFALCAAIVPLLSVSDPVAYGMIEAGGVNATLMHPKLDYSLIRVCLSLGYSAINFLYTPIVSRFGVSAPFVCTLVFVLALLGLSGALRRFETANTQRREKKAEPLDFRLLFRNYYLITFVLLNFILYLGSGTQLYLVYLLEEIGLSTALVGTASGIRVIGEIIMMPLVPLLKKKISLPMLQAVACVLQLLQMILYLTCKNPYVILAVISLNGLAGGITLGTTAVYLRMMAPKGLDTTTLSLSSVMQCFGSIVMSAAGGRLVDSMGIFSLYRFAAFSLTLWLILYFGTWLFGKYVLKKTPPVEMLLRKSAKSA